MNGTRGGSLAKFGANFQRLHAVLYFQGYRRPRRLLSRIMASRERTVPTSRGGIIISSSLSLSLSLIPAWTRRIGRFMLYIAQPSPRGELTYRARKHTTLLSSSTNVLVKLSRGVRVSIEKERNRTKWKRTFPFVYLNGDQARNPYTRNNISVTENIRLIVQLH